eukprot:CAMPEP_0115166584 /NCGR_PEP_ID=MMETSP0227-20121206/74201_1 /TAXON_ID=89957 /ORGANISM="Polarella glacialis, Strain CCMP 1383" /LENGTH=153 /DNA_ID=CAMNT_0002579127 /DNA_START=24 /DNA_END=483 /DNA_ORIENTATION=-
MAIITVSAPMYISPDQEGKAYKETFCKTGRYFGKEAALFLSDLSHESHTDEALSDVSTLAGSSGFHSASSSQAGDDQSDSSSEADDSDQGIFAFFLRRRPAALSLRSARARRATNLEWISSKDLEELDAAGHLLRRSMRSGEGIVVVVVLVLV